MISPQRSWGACLPDSGCTAGSGECIGLATAGSKWPQVLFIDCLPCEKALLLDSLSLWRSLKKWFHMPVCFTTSGDAAEQAIWFPHLWNSKPGLRWLPAAPLLRPQCLWSVQIPLLMLCKGLSKPAGQTLIHILAYPAASYFTFPAPTGPVMLLAGAPEAMCMSKWEWVTCGPGHASQGPRHTG